MSLAPLSPPSPTQLGAFNQSKVNSCPIIRLHASSWQPPHRQIGIIVFEQSRSEDKGRKKKEGMKIILVSDWMEW